MKTERFNNCIVLYDLLQSNIYTRVVHGNDKRPVRFNSVKDSSPAGRNNFFFTGLVWTFLPICQKNDEKNGSFGNGELCPNVVDHFSKKMCTKLSY